MTVLSGVVAESLSKIAVINERITKLAEEAKAARLAALEPFLDVLAASGEVSLIVIYGYTPGFNDGEPCTHSADFLVNVRDVFGEDWHDRRDIGLPEELIEGLDWGNETRNAELAKEHGHVYAKPSQEIIDAISSVVFDTVEEENGTDYYVAYVLKDGKFEKFEGHYDCGY